MGKGENFPEAWLPQPFNDVNDDPSPLNEEQCVIMLGAGDSACQAVKSVANKIYAEVGRDVESMPMRFFSAPEGGVTTQLRKLTGYRSWCQLAFHPSTSIQFFEWAIV